MDFEFFSVIPQYEYPEHYEDVVIKREGMWPAWLLVPVWKTDERVQFCEVGSYRTIDTAHPKCYFCGKFIKNDDSWKYEGYTGPCRDCYEDTTWL
jgi:hypothetical protein